LRISSGLAVDAAGNLFVGDGGTRVRKISKAGIITTVAGNGFQGYSGDGGGATQAQLNPYNLSVDAPGNVFIAEPADNRVRKVSPAGIITTVAGNGNPGTSGDGGLATEAAVGNPTDIAINSAGDLFIAASPRIRAVLAGRPTLTVSTAQLTFTGV